MVHHPAQNETSADAASGAEPLDPARAASPSVRIKGLVAAANQVQRQLTHGIDAGGAEAIRRRVTELTAQVDAICRDTRATPADLPTQSRRAYQWLRYLSDADNIAAHLATLALLRRILDQADWAGPALLAGRAVRFELFHMDMLYRINAKGRDIVLTAAQGFAGAPPEVLEALLKAALQPYAPPPVRRPALAAIKAYAAGEDFAEVTTALELLAEPSEASLRGRHYDHAQVFDRVSAACFDGRMPRPNLTWSRALTARKLGHYYPAGDTVMLSRALAPLPTPPGRTIRAASSTWPPPAPARP
jgi:hypothetical protein